MSFGQHFVGGEKNPTTHQINYIHRFQEQSKTFWVKKPKKHIACTCMKDRQRQTHYDEQIPKGKHSTCTETLVLWATFCGGKYIFYHLLPSN